MSGGMEEGEGEGKTYLFRMGLMSYGESWRIIHHQGRSRIVHG